ncbi:UNVERIFIED_CONTAM: hypothetical protein Slati_2894000 [Sesamum latifolium]|uniref:Uncharacterized protein n=1 Tax=Sesamum latifolium TaxID=2727402 RepID=A0AAW2VDC2_9LAMI
MGYAAVSHLELAMGCTSSPWDARPQACYKVRDSQIPLPSSSPWRTRPQALNGVHDHALLTLSWTRNLKLNLGHVTSSWPLGARTHASPSLRAQGPHRSCSHQLEPNHHLIPIKSSPLLPSQQTCARKALLGFLS